MSKSRQSEEDAAVRVRSFAVTFPAGQLIPSGQIAPPQTGRWHQLVYAARGVMTVRTYRSTWVVPPQRGLWVPRDVQYRLQMRGEVALRILYVRAGSGVAGCCAVNVNPLLRELILRTCLLGALDSRIPEQRRLIGVIGDEVRQLRETPLQLLMPEDPRAVRFAELTAQNSGRRLPWVKSLRLSGASRRTLERLFRTETGMSLGRWLRRRNVLYAVGALASGERVNAIAHDLGYQGASAFVAMFRKETGHTPSRYFEV